MSFSEAVEANFPGAMSLAPFVRRAAVSLIQDFGFAPSNTLACVGVCRDELCRPLVDEVESMWGETFDLASLAGILTVGKTGFAAARQHAPEIHGRRRYLFFLFAHIGISAEGEPGMVDRPGQSGPTPACGALVALQRSLRDGETVTRIEWEDPEQSLLHLRLRRIRDLGPEPSLLELTRAVHRATVEDLGRLVADTLDPHNDDHAVISGILIHGPDRAQMIWPGDTHIVVSGRRSEVWF